MCLGLLTSTAGGVLSGRGTVGGRWPTYLQYRALASSRKDAVGGREGARGLTCWAVRSLRLCFSLMIGRCGRRSRKRSGDPRRTWSWRACLASSSSAGWTRTGSPCRGEWGGHWPSGLEEPTPAAAGSPGQVLEDAFGILVIVGSALCADRFPADGSEMCLRPGPCVLILQRAPRGLRAVWWGLFPGSVGEGAAAGDRFDASLSFSPWLGAGWSPCALGVDTPFRKVSHHLRVLGLQLRRCPGRCDSWSLRV